MAHASIIKMPLIMLVMVALVGAQGGGKGASEYLDLNGQNGVVENRQKPVDIFSEIKLNAQKNDSLHSSLKKTYGVYGTKYKVGPAIKVNINNFKKRMKELVEFEQYRRGFLKKMEHDHAESDSILDLSGLLGKRLRVRIVSVDTSFMNMNVFTGYIEGQSGTTWVGFTINSQGKLNGQITGFEGRVLNIESVGDGMYVCISVPFGIPNRKY